MSAGGNLNNLKSNESSNLARKHDALVDFVRTVILCPGVGYQRTVTPLGTVLRIKPSQSSSNIHPFKLLDASEGGTKKIRVVFGTVNSMTPEGMSDGDEPPYVLSVSSSGVIYLVVTVDPNTQEINSVTIGEGSELPAPSTSEFRLTIGTYSINNDSLSIAQAISGSQAFQLCGGVVPLWGLM